MTSYAAAYTVEHGFKSGRILCMRLNCSSQLRTSSRDFLTIYGGSIIGLFLAGFSSRGLYHNNGSFTIIGINGSNRSSIGKISVGNSAGIRRLNEIIAV